jgi:hypothetical protein
MKKKSLPKKFNDLKFSKEIYSKRILYKKTVQMLFLKFKFSSTARK